MPEPTTPNPAVQTPDMSKDADFIKYKQQRGAEALIHEWETSPRYADNVKLLLEHGLKEKILAKPEIASNALALEEALATAKEKFLNAGKQPKPSAAPTPAPGEFTPTPPTPPAPDAAKHRYIQDMSLADIAKAANVTIERAADIKVYGTGRSPINMN